MQSMGKHGERLYFLLEKLGVRIFSIDDVRKLGFSKVVTKKVLASLTRRKVISRVIKGVYVRASPQLLYDALQQVESTLLVAAKAAKKDYYIGFISAMQAHGITEQVPFVVCVASLKRKRNFVYAKTKVQYIRLDKKRFFGYETIKYAKSEIVVSNKEKTIIDCVAFPEYSGGMGNAAAMIMQLCKDQKIDWKLLCNYALQMENQALLHRLGYVFEEINKIEEKQVIPLDVIKFFESKVKPSVYYLENRVTGKFVKKWHLIANEVVDYGV